MSARVTRPCHVIISIGLVAATALAASPNSALAAPCWAPPVDGVVSDPFREPPCPYCAGNRGIEYRVGRRAVISAVASGVVTWSGSIAGTRYVVVGHSNGWRATYGKLVSTSLGAGDRVLVGSRIGVASSDFYFGLRDGDAYIDPGPYIGRLVGRPRLVPIDGTRARPAPAPRTRCGT